MARVRRGVKGRLAEMGRRRVEGRKQGGKTHGRMAVGWRFQGGARAAVVALISYHPDHVPPYDPYIPLRAHGPALQFDKLSRRPYYSKLDGKLLPFAGYRVSFRTPVLGRM